MLQNEYLVAKIGVDTAENGPRKEWRECCVSLRMTNARTTSCVFGFGSLARSLLVAAISSSRAWARNSDFELVGFLIPGLRFQIPKFSFPIIFQIPCDFDISSPWYSQSSGSSWNSDEISSTSVQKTMEFSQIRTAMSLPRTLPKREMWCWRSG